jgi:hypothetical protein
MKYSFVTVLCSMPFISSVCGFVQKVKPVVNTFTYVGDIKPTGYFDPLFITTRSKEQDIKYVREAELQHGRVAMLSFVSLVSLDMLNDDLAINQLYSLSWEQQFPFWFGVGCYEFARMGAGWKNPFVKGNSMFKLEDDYQPGNIFKLPSDSYTEEQLNRELSNGRLAMFGCLGYLAQEYVQQTSIV